MFNWLVKILFGTHRDKCIVTFKNALDDYYAITLIPAKVTNTHATKKSIEKRFNRELHNAKCADGSFMSIDDLTSYMSAEFLHLLKMNHYDSAILCARSNMITWLKLSLYAEDILKEHLAKSTGVNNDRSGSKRV